MKPVTTFLIFSILTIATVGCMPKPTLPPAIQPAAVQPTSTVPPPLEATSQTKASQLPTREILPTAADTVRPGEVPVELTPAPGDIQADFPSKSNDWQTLPIIPAISQRAAEIYQLGVASGNNPRAFSKIGDCGSSPAWFLGDFDRGERFYSLGEYASLLPVIEQFQGSYSRTSLAARSGFNVSSIFAPLWADPGQCETNETPVECEYRLHRPSVAFIMLGSNDVFHPDEFEPGMRQLIEFFIARGVVPILSTKADNLEGDNSLNATMARLAMEYDIPLINYWRALQSLPNAGLQNDKVHITWGPNRFDDPYTMTKGWPVRNLTALQTLDAVWRAVTGQNTSQ